MPPEKRQVKTLKVGIGVLEDYLLEHLQRATGGNASDHVRAAIVEYAKHHPGLREPAIRLAISTMEANLRYHAVNLRPTREGRRTPEEQTQLIAELERFLTSRVSRPASAPSRAFEEPSTLTGSLPRAARQVGAIDDDEEETEID